MQTLEEFLAHYGVPGMKWGVRRNNSGGGDAVSHPISDDHARATAALTKARTHGLSSLSTAEMRDMTNRMEVERKFRQLTTEQAKASRSLGRKLIDSMLGDLTQVAAREASSFNQKLLRDVVQKKTGATESSHKPKKVKNLDEVLAPYSNRR